MQGIHHVPAEGAATLVANHGGAIPFDGVMLSTALRREHPAQRQLRWLAEDFVFHMPFAGAFVNRIGAVRACQENAERLIRQGNVVALFPEGVKGIGQLFPGPSNRRLYPSDSCLPNESWYIARSRHTNTKQKAIAQHNYMDINS